MFSVKLDFSNVQICFKLLMANIALWISLYLVNLLFVTEKMTKIKYIFLTLLANKCFESIEKNFFKFFLTEFWNIDVIS